MHLLEPWLKWTLTLTTIAIFVLPLAVRLVSRLTRAYAKRYVEHQRALWMGRWEDAERIEWLSVRETLKEYGND